ncbi:hypothetical protein NP493_1847g00017 [Ridgeia piscesae]|uniref:Uncharacterized protein n=1 Tax=Ridgeia piscesae TaxID=27915 RepID=A0AAD9JSJ5_RIDPI|nr:hypothetical protein NP493_1847g00017 [Ridgeia piscesae]
MNFGILLKCSNKTRKIESMSVVVLQEGEAQVVSGEMASILKTSRFASKFTLTATDKLPTVAEVVMVDPFEYVARDTTENGSKCCPDVKGRAASVAVVQRWKAKANVVEANR